MTDYRLDGLNARSFEHLVQALCVNAMTGTVTPFGDGPDGGREATFEGPTRYGVGADKWDGYGVVQAKFLQRPTDTSTNNKWLLKELRAELARYRKRNSKRKMDYYIVATNIALTPVADVGSKDKVFAELQQFARKYGLKGVDVWDYDKIRILLDNNEDVRRAYSAWTTPGDVLADLAEALKPQRLDFHRLIVNFLQKEMLADQFAKLEQAGHSADEAIPLSQVFVDVPVALEAHSDLVENSTAGQKSRYFADLIIREASVHCREDGWRIGTESPRIVPGRHVLIGGPGQGKTTVGQYICQVFRAALLAEVRVSAVDQESLTIVRAIQRQWDDGVLAVPGARRIPFRVVLSEFAKSLADGHTSGLLAYLTALFNARTNADLKVSQFEALLTAYPSILILDGLDEVPASTNRSQVLSSVKEFWADIAASKITTSGIDILVVATSRPQGYNEDFSPKFYSHHWMIPLSAAQAIEYGGKLAEVRFSGDTDRVAKVQRRIRRAAENDATARLMRSPLQVTILTLLLDRMGQPPQERWPLFDEYFKLIYQREIERDIPAAAILREYKSNIVTVHRQVGLLLQVEAERSGGTDARLTVEQFKEVVKHHLRDEGHQGETLTTLTNSIIEAAANRLVFLVGLESGQVGFEIRSLQEFMAAEGLMAAGDTTTQDRLKAVAGNTNWRNVFLFAAGKCFFDRQYLRDTIHTVCHELNEDLDDKTARLTLAGSELALDVLEEGSAQRQPRWNRMLTRTALRLLDDTSSDWPQRLAEIWVNETSDVFISEICSRIERGEPTSAQNAWLCLVHLAVHSGSVFTELLTDLLDARHIDEGLFKVFLQHGNPASLALNEFLGRVVLHYPAALFVNSVIHFIAEDENDVHRRWDNPHVPGWLEPLTEKLRKSRFLRQGQPRIQVRNSETLLLRVSVPSVEESLEISQKLDSFPGGDHGWASVKACFDFLKSPNKGTLANALKASAGDLSGNTRYWLASMAPWPLQEAMLAARDANHCEALANAAINGLLGDTEDWLACELNWLERGISIDEITDGDILEAGLSGRSWLPVRCMDKQVRGTPSHLLDSLVDAVCTAPAGVGRDFIAQLAGRMIIGNELKAAPDAGTRAGFLEAVIDSSWILGLKCLLALLPDGLVEGHWRTRLVSSIPGIKAGFFLFHGSSRLAEDIQQAWLSNRDAKELLLILAHLGDPYERNPQFIQEMAALNVSGDSDRIKFARLALLLRGSYWDEMVADQVRELIFNDTDTMVQLVQAVNQSTGSVSEDEAVLLHLHDIALISGAQLVYLNRALRERMRARQSALTSAASWTRLGFSPELSRLIEPIAVKMD
ncbi:hypothetical protein AB0O34_33935 [Sphaerisporangium sp. NPDC088356]|uniref:NACHT domain-containing protein n=1 Tax=Sphaerisporangium sp. NPDC088356 TaxID=3154871 RepID=UPI00341D84DF